MQWFNLSFNQWKENKPKMNGNYAELTREWKSGDKIEIELPLPIQKIKADSRIKYDKGRVALYVVVR
jgi:DUF1680 family protein